MVLLDDSAVRLPETAARRGTHLGRLRHMLTGIALLEDLYDISVR